MTLQKPFHQKKFSSRNRNDENSHSWKGYYWSLLSMRAYHGHFILILNFGMGLLITNI